MPGKTARYSDDRKGRKIMNRNLERMPKKGNHRQRENRDMENICQEQYIPWERLRGKSIFITGATGLIGQTLVHALQYKNRMEQLNCRILVYVRNRDKAEWLFGRESAELGIYIGDITEKPEIREPVHYVIHGACQTSSSAFVREPVETIHTSVAGTDQMLKLAAEKRVEGFVYLSTMEIYGAPETDEKIPEDHPSNLNPTAVRSSYPESKRICECLCTSYCREYQVPARIVRLTQTFGPGVAYNDGRIFAEFARCVIEEKDIILHTEGKTKRSYLYTADAVSAIFTVLLNGQNQEAYNAANEESYCSVYQMACMVAEWFGGRKTKVRIQIPENLEGYGYAPTLHMNLDTGKLRKLGWRPKYSLKQSYAEMIVNMKTDRQTEEEPENPSD